MRKPQTGKNLVPETVAASYLGTKVQTLRNWRYIGLGPDYVRLNGRMIRYDVADLDRYIESLKVSHELPQAGR